MRYIHLNNEVKKADDQMNIILRCYLVLYT